MSHVTKATKTPVQRVDWEWVHRHFKVLMAENHQPALNTGMDGAWAALAVVLHGGRWCSSTSPPLYGDDVGGLYTADEVEPAFDPLPWLGELGMRRYAEREYSHLWTHPMIELTYSPQTADVWVHGHLIKANASPRQVAALLHAAGCITWERMVEVVAGWEKKAADAQIADCEQLELETQKLREVAKSRGEI